VANFPQAWMKADLVEADAYEEIAVFRLSATSVSNFIPLETFFGGELQVC
jgi:hypothetical protein